VLTGACVTPVEGDERLLALALLYALTDGRLALRIGRGLTAGGEISDGWTDLVEVPVPAGAQIRTASVTATQAEGRALLVHYTADVAGQLTSEYVVAPGLTAAGGVVPGWTGPVPIPGARQAAVAVAVAVLDWGRDPSPGLTSPSRGVNLLAALRQAWHAVLDADRVPRVSPDPAQSSPQSLLESLLDVLSGDAVSDSVRTRGVIGPTLAGNLWRLLGVELGPGVGAGYEARLRGAVEAALAFTGIDVHGRITRVGYETDAWRFWRLVSASAQEQEEEPLPEAAPRPRRARGSRRPAAATLGPARHPAGLGRRGVRHPAARRHRAPAARAGAHRRRRPHRPRHHPAHADLLAPPVQGGL
jgi:hypothetical protein